MALVVVSRSASWDLETLSQTDILGIFPLLVSRSFTLLKFFLPMKKKSLAAAETLGNGAEAGARRPMSLPRASPRPLTRLCRQAGMNITISQMRRQRVREVKCLA